MCFGLEKFHTYLYGRHVTIQKGYKPLGMIQQKPIHVASHCLPMHASSHAKKNDYTIQYKPGKEMLLADHPSHFPSYRESFPIPKAQSIEHVQLSTAKLDAIQAFIEHDLVYSTLYCPTPKRMGG